MEKNKIVGAIITRESVEAFRSVGATTEEMRQLNRETRRIRRDAAAVEDPHLRFGLQLMAEETVNMVIQNFIVGKEPPFKSFKLR